MKTNSIFGSALMVVAALSFSSCNEEPKQDDASGNASAEVAAPAGQSAVADNESAKDVVKVAVGSPDHTTLVAALKAAEYVDVLSNAGPFTVFAPTNAAFNKLPAGTVEGLLKPEKKNDLRNILEYHVTTSSLKPEYFKDGQSVGMVNGQNVKVSVQDGKIQINGANVLGNVQASNGMIYVLDALLLPPAK